jgi:ribosomal protein S18 acetylase RimI-like enzyme
MNNNAVGFIRQATVEDAPFIAPIILLAMGSLASYFTNNADEEEKQRLFEVFIQQKNNQYSFENTLVYQEDQVVIGAVNAYNGNDLEHLRSSFINYIAQHYKVIFPSTENETEPGEYYIDCVSVHPQHQGKGIGKQLLLAMIEKGKSLGFSKIGLLVSVENFKAKKLYLSLGFEEVKIKNFMSDPYFHMQKQL